MVKSGVKVKLYGESFKVHSLDITKNNYDLFKKVAILLNESLEEAILNASFFNILNLEEYDSLLDLINQTFGGLINNSNSKIEIWKGRRCLQRITFNDLFDNNTLFPLFNISKKKTNIEYNQGMFLIEKEVSYNSFEKRRS